MGKGSRLRPVDRDAFIANFERIFRRDTSPSGVPELSDAARNERWLTLSLDELRVIVFKTSVAYARSLGNSVQAAEWERAAALRASLTELGYTREAEMIGDTE
jgi:hypothetical protein